MCVIDLWLVCSGRLFLVLWFWILDLFVCDVVWCVSGVGVGVWIGCGCIARFVFAGGFVVGGLIVLACFGFGLLHGLCCVFLLALLRVLFVVAIWWHLRVVVGGLFGIVMLACIGVGFVVDDFVFVV